MRILVYPDPLLRESGTNVKDLKDVENVFDDMVRTMYENKGVGLAATQVGIGKRFFVINVERQKGDEQVLINPHIVEGRDEIVAVEGCLSLPGLETKVPRYEWIRLRATTLDGKDIELADDGLFTRVVQHECDHLNGKLIIDGTSPAARIVLRGLLKEMEDRYVPRK